MKTCSKCGVPKDEAEFYKRPNRAIGFCSQCRECMRASSAAWKLRNPERTRELSRKSAAEFFRKFPERVRANAKASVKRRLKTNLDFRILHRLRRRLNHALLGRDRGESTLELLGCSVEYFRFWMQLQFRPNMTWENYGQWHVDHKRPCASFDLSDSEQRKLCFHYSNLQPLWARENQSKGASYALV